MLARPITARPITASAVSARHISTQQRNTYRIASCGDSTCVHGTRYSMVESYSGFRLYGRSNDTGWLDLEANATGTLTVYPNSTATWAAPDDTAGPVVQVGSGLTWMESATAGRGMGFVVPQSVIQGADVGGTAYPVSILEGSSPGYVGTGWGDALGWAQVITGGRLQVTGQHGFAGIDTRQMLQALPNVLTRDSEGKSLDAPPDAVYFSIGINDVWFENDPDGSLSWYGYEITEAETLQNITEMVEYCVERGVIALFSTLQRESPGALAAMMNVINDHLEALQAQYYPMMRVVDARAAVNVPETDDAKPGYMTGPHYTNHLGCYVMGTVLADVLDQVAGARLGRSAYMGDRPNLVHDGAMLGTDGALTNATGVSAWQVCVGECDYLPSLGDATAVCSQEASSNGEYHPWQVIDVTGGTEESYVVASSPLEAIYDVMQAEVEVYTSNLQISGYTFVSGPKLMLMYFDGGGQMIRLSETISGVGVTLGGVDPETGVTEFSGLLRTGPITTPAGAVSARLAVMWGQPAGVDATVKLRNAGARAIA